MPWGRAGLDVVVTTDGDRDVFLVFVGASTGLEPAGARFMMRAAVDTDRIRQACTRRVSLHVLPGVCVQSAYQEILLNPAFSSQNSPPGICTTVGFTRTLLAKVNPAGTEFTRRTRMELAHFCQTSA